MECGDSTDPRGRSLPTFIVYAAGMKRTKQCPKCDSTRVGYLPYQPDNESSFVEAGVLHETSHLSRDRVLGRGPVLPETWSKAERAPLIGQLETYVCTECGYHETYVQAPREFAWQQVQGFRWVNDEPPPQGPFR